MGAVDLVNRNPLALLRVQAAEAGRPGQVFDRRELQARWQPGTAASAPSRRGTCTIATTTTSRGCRGPARAEHAQRSNKQERGPSSANHGRTPTGNAHERISPSYTRGRHVRVTMRWRERKAYVTSIR